MKFSASADPGGVPVLSYVWKFGDGTSGRGSHPAHSYTWAGNYTVEVDVEGVDGIAAHKTVPIRVTGVIQSPFPLSRSRRYVEP